MANFFGWESKTKDEYGRDLTLSGISDKRFETLLKNISQDWIPFILMQTNGGFIGSSGGTRHWVGVVGIGVHNKERFVYIYNPVNDQPTRYSWEVFYSSLSIKYFVKDKITYQEYLMNHNGLALVRPPRRPTMKKGPIPE
jgi:hypothetical protein